MMKRPMVQISVALCIGIVLAFFIRQIVIVFMLFPLYMIILLYGYRKKIAMAKNILLWGIFIFIGYANYACQYTLLSEPLKPYYENDVVVTGYVNSACEAENNKITFQFFVEEINDKKHIGRNILVNVYNFKNVNDYSPGTGLVLKGVLRSPPGSRNPGGFNYENYLYAKKIPATMYLSANNTEKTGHIKKLPLKRFGLNLRRYILDTLDKNLSEEKAALIGAMLTGYRGNMTESMENAFSAAGLTHIMAVSGANIAFLIFPLLWIFSMAGMDRRISSVIAIPFIFLYLLVTGIEPSVLRASVMAVLLLLGKALHRRVEVVNSVAVTAFLLLIINPFMLFDVGFQLSVGATLGLGILYKRVREVFPKKVPGFVSETIASTLSAQAGVFPLLIMYFNRISLVSIFTNLLVVPVTGFATCLGAVCVAAASISPFLGKITGYALEAVLHFILAVADTCASFEWAEVYTQHWSYCFIFLYYALLILWGKYGWDFFRYNKAKLVACILLTGIVLFIRGVVPGQLKVIFADVGQGDCILISTPEGRNYLIDGAGTYNEEETGYYGRQVILPMLMHQRIPHIDMAFVTHAHSDHMAGVLTLIEIYPVKSVGLPEYPNAESDFDKLIGLCESKNIPVFFYKEGDIVHMDSKTTFEVINPPSENISFGGNLNDTSVCGMLKFKDLSILLTGDIEREAEKMLIKYGNYIDCDILKVAHHGGKESTTPEFLSVAKPETAVISVGRNNYGHPSEEVIQRLMQSGTRFYTTEECGAVIVESNGNHYIIRPWVRKRAYTFFHADNHE